MALQSLLRSSIPSRVLFRSAPCSTIVLSDRDLYRKRSHSSRHLSTTNQYSYENIAQTAADHLQTFHETISFDVLPWSVTIPLAALSLRVFTLPLVYYSQIHHGRAALAATELPRIHHFVRKAPGTLIQKYRTFRRLRLLTLKAAGTAPFQQFPWHLTIHMPMIILSSMGLRALAGRDLLEWHNSGPFFAPDLLAPDPYGILPVFTTAMWVWNLDPRLDTRRRATAAIQENTTERSRLVDNIMTRAGNTVTTFLQMVAVVALIVTTELPTGVVLLWASNGVITAIQRWALSRDSVRTYLGLPTAKDIMAVQRSNIMPAIEHGVEHIRKELSYIQTRMLQVYEKRAVDESLCADINRMLKRERWSGRISSDLEAVIRQDERDGKLYVAVVRRGSSTESP